MSRIKSDQFDFGLRDITIAQAPRPFKEHRLLVHKAGNDSNIHTRVEDIYSVLQPGDLLVFNNSRVFPASLYRDDGSFVLFTNPFDPRLKNVKAICPFKPAVGDVIEFPFANIHIRAHEPGWDVYLVDVESVDPFPDLPSFLGRFGQMPMPIYLKRVPTAADTAALQNFFAVEPGSIAPPVAGQHFSPELIQTLRRKGILTAEVTLHVGYGTFRSFKSEYIDQHEMDSELYSIPGSVIDTIKRVKRCGGRVIAVGTTSARVLETVGDRLPYQPIPQILRGETSIFIYPGYIFNTIDGLITNFQYPRLPVIAMAAAITGIEELRRVYDDAIVNNYMFYSYGDAMLLFR